MSPTPSPSDGLLLFRPSLAPRNRRPRGVVGMAALVDVILLFIGFLLLNLPFVLQPGIAIALPDAPFTDGAAYANAIVVTMAQEELIFLNDERTTLAALDAALARALHRKPGATLLIEADARVPFASLVRVYNIALQQGMTDIVLATRGTMP